VARNIVVVLFILVWGAVVVVTAIQENGKVPAEYWTIPAVGVGAILGAFAAFGDKRDDQERRTRPEDDSDTSRDNP
jgi:hypothetical protein